jgi:subtilisin family serine protease
LISIDGNTLPQQSDATGITFSKRVAREFTGPDIIVAVVDTGVDYSHPDLREHMWRNPGEVAGNGIDDDKNGYVDDVYGVNTADGTGDPMDQNGHGTHVAGITLNTAGELGPDRGRVKIMALRFLNAQGMGGLVAAIKAIEYLVDMKRRGVDVRISNNSWGGAPYSDVLMSAVSMVRDADIAFVAAAGNFGNNNDEKPEYPASLKLPNILSVAAVDSDNNLASFSNYGENSVHIAAQGVRITSTFPNGSYKTMSGTSMAAPVITGELARASMETDYSSTSELISAVLSGAGHSVSLDGVVIDSRLIARGNQAQPGSREPGNNGNGGVLTTIRLQAIGGDGVTRGVLYTGDDLSIEGEGLGSLKVSLVLQFDSYKCENPIRLQLSDGRGEKALKLGSLTKWFRRISVLDRSSGTNAEIGIRGRARAGKGGAMRRAASICKRLSLLEY